MTVTSTPIAPPVMNNPEIIDLSKTGGQTFWSFSPDQDVVFIGSNSLDTNQKLQTSGGHNIEVLGGDFAPTAGATGTLAFYGITGTAFVDGVHIDNKNAPGTDGIDIAGNGGHTALTVENSSIVNVNGANSGSFPTGGNGHADGIQIQGDMGGAVNLDNLHITTNYQGLFISPQYAIAPSSAHLSNVDLSYTGPSSNGGTSSYLLWTLDDASQKPYPFTFDNVYVQPRAGQNVADGNTVWPDANATGNLHPTISNGQITWPGLPYSGHITIGSPNTPTVNEGQIGTNFVTDGDATALSGGNASSVGSGSGAGTTVGSSNGSSGSTGTPPPPVTPPTPPTITDIQHGLQHLLSDLGLLADANGQFHAGTLSGAGLGAVEHVVSLDLTALSHLSHWM